MTKEERDKADADNEILMWPHKRPNPDIYGTNGGFKRDAKVDDGIEQPSRERVLAHLGYLVDKK